jgi:type IV pilus assembly protein PilM
MARIVGLDLGHHTARAAVFEGSFGRFQLVGYHEVPVAQDIDAPPDLTAQLSAVEQLVGRIDGTGSTSWAAGFPTELTSLRTISLPFSDRAQVEQTLQFEVENQVPFDLDEMVLSHRIIEVTDSGSEVLCALAPRATVAPLLSGLAGLAADPKLLVVDADLLAHHADQGVQAIIDLGHTRTTVSLCQDGHMVAGRALSHGGRELTVALAKAMGVDFETAERRKHQVGLGHSEDSTHELELGAEWEESEDTRPNIAVADWDDETTMDRVDRVDPETAASRRNPETVLRDALVPLLADLRATLISYEDSIGLEIDEVLLAGGGSAMTGLKDLLAEVLGVGVRVVYPSEQAEIGQGSPGRFALCHAAGVRASGGKGRLLDVRVGDFTFKGDLALLGTLIQYGLVAAALLVVAGIGWFAFRVAALNAEVAGVEDEIAEAVVAVFPDVDRGKLDDPSMAVAIMQEKTLETTAWVETLGSIVNDQPPTLTMLERISQNVPPPNEARIDVSELSVNPGSITIKAETDGYEAAAKIETALQAAPGFKDANKGDEKKVREEVRFTITIPLESDETEAG